MKLTYDELEADRDRAVQLASDWFDAMKAAQERADRAEARLQLAARLFDRLRANESRIRELRALLK